MTSVKNLEDIERLFNDKTGESLIIEYKRELDKYDHKIAEDISSFANTFGGTIFYGIDAPNGIPVSKNWINTRGINQKIEDIISNIEPKIEGYNIHPIENPDNSSQAIFIVEIPESSELHMANYRYYKRYNLKSEPMGDDEVKNQMFRKGLKKALNFEISKNLELSENTLKYIENINYVDNPLYKIRGSVQLIPFYTDAWRSVVNSGLLFILKEQATILVKVYSLIHEINYIIDHRSLDEDIITPIHDNQRLEFATMVPYILSVKIKELRDILKDLSF